VEDLFQPGKMEPVYRGSDIAAICFSVSAMVAVKKRGHRVLVWSLDSLFCRWMGMCAYHLHLAANSGISACVPSCEVLICGWKCCGSRVSEKGRRFMVSSGSLPRSLSWLLCSGAQQRHTINNVRLQLEDLYRERRPRRGESITILSSETYYDNTPRL
jgi:hypothetical protein